MNTRKYTVITGASSGIGYETAKVFAVRNKNLILVARRKERLAALKQEILVGNPALDIIIREADLSDSAQVYQLYEDLKVYNIETWINNAGRGSHDSVGEQNLNVVIEMLHLNMDALTILSSLYARDYKNVEGTQLINVASAAGYMIYPGVVTYSATKFYVSAFTEGLDHELKMEGCKMRAKVLAPAATQTEFAQIENDLSEFDYDKVFKKYHTAAQMAEFLLRLYDSDKTVGGVNMNTFEFTLEGPRHQYFGIRC